MHKGFRSRTHFRVMRTPKPFLTKTPTSAAHLCILAEGAIALPVTLSGGVLFASWKLLQFPSSLIVKVILAIFMRASAQQCRPQEPSIAQCQLMRRSLILETLCLYDHDKAHQWCKDAKSMAHFVDCTCTGSLLQWFPELTLDNQDEQLNHDDDVLHCAADRMCARASCSWLDERGLRNVPEWFSNCVCMNDTPI